MPTYFIHNVRCNASTNNLEREIQEFASEQFSCTTTDNPQEIYELLCKKVGELNEKHKRCKYQVVQSHAHDWDKIPHTITIAPHTKNWESAHCTILFSKIRKKNEPFTFENFVKIFEYGNENSGELMWDRFIGCYFTDEKAFIQSLCDIDKAKFERFSQELNAPKKGCDADCQHCNYLADFDDEVDKEKAAMPLWAFIRTLSMFLAYAKYPENTEVIGEAFEIFNNPNYYYLKWKIDCEQDSLLFISLLDDKELLVIYKAYEAKLRERYNF